MLKRTLCLGLVLAGAVMGQGLVTFEPQNPPCTYSFPVGCNTAGDPEGCTKNGAAAINTVDVANGLGMPCQGNQYARVSAEGPFAVPGGDRRRCRECETAPCRAKNAGNARSTR